AQLRNAAENLGVVETQYVGKGEPGTDATLERRFSDGEIQYLLQDWPTASVLFYDLISDKAFDSNPKRPDALWYLADSLYQQTTSPRACLYSRRPLARHPPRSRVARARSLGASAKLKDWGALEPSLAGARGPEGRLPNEVQYVYGKWLARRGDLSPAERRKRA